MRAGKKMLLNMAGRIGRTTGALLSRYWVSILLPLAAVLLQWPIEPLTKHTSYQLFLAAVALSALHGGIGSGLIALVLSAAAKFSLFLAPHAGDSAVVFPLVLFLLLGLLVAWLAGEARSARRKLAQVLRDVSREKEMEAQLRHSQEMKELGRFAAGVAHDLNNLLTLVSGYGDMLRSRLDGSGQRSLEEPVEEILNASERGARLTSRLLAFSRRQAAHPDAPDLNDSPKPTEEGQRSDGRARGTTSPKPSEVPACDGSILVAEDDESVRKLVCSVLRANNYTVLEAKDGAEALRIASRNVNSIALVIADPALPLLSGPRLVDRLWILRPDIQVLYTSADGDSTGFGAGRASVRFLQKPFGVTALLFTVDAMLGRQPQRA